MNLCSSTKIKHLQKYCIFKKWPESHKVILFSALSCSIEVAVIGIKIASSYKLPHQQQLTWMRLLIDGLNREQADKQTQLLRKESDGLSLVLLCLPLTPLSMVSWSPLWGWPTTNWCIPTGRDHRVIMRAQPLPRHWGLIPAALQHNLVSLLLPNHTSLPLLPPRAVPL